jgi:tetratricopeptide (TPR) repeat protein
VSDPVSLISSPGARRAASCFVGSLAVRVALLGAAILPMVHAAPFVPNSDSEVVERLPTRWGSSEQRRGEQQARLRLRTDPMQLSLALPLARDAIERARRLGDPRELGQAQAALAPWWGQPSPPPSVRLMRATVLQSQHQFDAALADLDALVNKSPTAAAADVSPSVRAQAELTRSAVLQVLGRWPEAEAGCARLASDRYAALGPAVHTSAKACLAELASLQGKAPQARRLLADLSRQHSNPQDPQTQAWLFLLRAELAERQGASQEAQALYRQALGQGAAQASVYTLVAYADWLLAHGREREVPSLLAGREEAEASPSRRGCGPTRPAFCGSRLAW